MNPEIPAILHQTWRTTELPSPFAEWRAGWIANHPDWSHRFYSDAAIRRVISDRAPQWLQTFETLPRMIQRVDFFRYLILYLDGGLYADIDMICYLPCDPLLKGASCVLSIENYLGKYFQTKFGYQQPWQLANFVLAARPNHPFLAALLEKIARLAATPIPNDDCVEDITGPRMLTRLACSMKRENRGAITILPQINFNPPVFYPRIGPLVPQIYARHVCSGSWRTGSVSWRRPWREWLGPRGQLPNPFATTGPVLP
jgi:inositol phosphorylceramide mannosyltransferase catalytic subunit